jgi:mono/diheme cytochrome c family protein
VGRVNRRFHAAAAIVIVVSTGLVACGEDAPYRLSNGEEYPASIVERGAEIYRVSCQSCHGAEGQGGRGEPLVDIWKSLTIEKHRTTIIEGRGEKMPAFGDNLTVDEIDALIAFERAGLSTQNN